MGRIEKEKYEKLLDSKKKLKNLEQELKQNDQICRDLQVRNRKVSSDIRNLSNIIAQNESTLKKEWQITDHAVLRYIERKYQLPIEDVKKEISEMIKNYGLGDTDNFMGFVLRGNTVITYKS